MIEALAVLAGLLAICKVKGWRVLQFFRYRSQRGFLQDVNPITDYYRIVPDALNVERGRTIRANPDVAKRMLLQEWGAKLNAEMVNGVSHVPGPHHVSCASRWGANPCDCGGPSSR